MAQEKKVWTVKEITDGFRNHIKVDSQIPVIGFNEYLKKKFVSLVEVEKLQHILLFKFTKHEDKTKIREVFKKLEGENGEQ